MSSISSGYSDYYAPSSAGSTSLCRPLVVLLLHGDNDILDPKYLREGSDGGRLAAQDLLACASQHLSKRGFQEGEYRFTCFYIYNRQNLVPVLLRAGAISEYTQFDQFVKGLNTSKVAAFVGVDAGSVKNSTQTKMAQFITLFSEPNSGDVLLLGGLHNAKYADLLRELPPTALELVTLVRTNRDKAPEFDDLPNVQTTRDFQALFDQKVVKGNGWGAPKGGRRGGAAAANGGAGTLGGGTKIPSTPTSPSLSNDGTLTSTHACNDHYLRPGGCKKSPCLYSHSYEFTPDEWTDLPLRAKRTPCKAAKHGGTCPDGEDCIWGHACSYTSDKCPHGKACWFVKAGMKHLGEA